jgi:hypothetical protein
MSNLFPNVPTFQTNDIFTRFGNAINYLLNRANDDTFGAAQFIPLVSGAEPPVLISDGAGRLIMVAWNP